MYYIFTHTYDDININVSNTFMKPIYILTVKCLKTQQFNRTVPCTTFHFSNTYHICIKVYSNLHLAFQQITLQLLQTYYTKDENISEI